MNDRRRLGIALLAVAAASACSGGGGGGPLQGFQLEDVSVDDGAVWPINREIAFTFSEPIDFASVSSNTISIQTMPPGEAPAIGEFRLVDERTVVFQPTCPTRGDLSDAGLVPGGTVYRIEVRGTNAVSGGNSVRSAVGRPLQVTQRRNFRTPDASSAFMDPHPQGPPQPVVRPAGSSDRDACYVEVGGDPDQRVYFERDGGELTLSTPGFVLPLNLYADAATHVAIVVQLDQPVHPAEDNLSRERLRLEFLDSAGTWQPLDTRVTLEKNCTEVGARVRLEPVGVLPVASAVRAVIRPGFQDFGGQVVMAQEEDFARAPTRTVRYETLTPQDRAADAFTERFDFGGESPLSFEDTDAVFDAPAAEWGNGKVTAALSFDGTGGPGGDFDWVVRPGEIFFFDTVSTFLVGGPGGIPSTRVEALAGVVDVHDLIIQAGGRVRVQGPNPLRINASGTVRIDGILDVSGFAARDIQTLNTGHQMEPGGVGVGGGGRGGNANENTTNSTPRGGTGQGPFGQPNVGGQGGEMGYNPAEGQGGKDQRRPGGGGGARFARDFPAQTTPDGVSLVASAGKNGHPQSRGATRDGARPALGGTAGPSSFHDPFDDNDFFGVRPVTDAEGKLVRLIRGELPSLWAGSGGGAGGNAGLANTFPTPNWNIGSDEKGGAGGGGGGAVHVKALGPIVFGAAGQILSNGAEGGTGENTLFRDHIGGTGGSGSGGHIVLESATLVDFTGGGLNHDLPAVDHLQACGRELKQGPLANVSGDSRNLSNGGAGGGGVIQIHVPESMRAPLPDPNATDVVIPGAALAFPDPLDQFASPAPYVMIPTFGARSKARSRWIPIGGADQRPTGVGLVQFLFGGVETVDPEREGLVLTDGSRVREVAPLVGGDLVDSDSATVLDDGVTLRLTGSALDAIRAGDGSAVSSDVYLRTPALLEDAVVRLEIEGNSTSVVSFPIAHALFDEGEDGVVDERLELLLRPVESRTPADYLRDHASEGRVLYALVPRFFDLVTDGVSGQLLPSATVHLLFQAAGETSAGLPDEEHVLVDWTADVERFNALEAGALRFFRFEAQFDLDAAGEGVTTRTKPVELELLRLPFVF